jgi:type I restriction enzyme S subunit
MARWTTKPLSEVCTFKPQKSEARAKLTSEDEVSFVPMENLGIGSKELALSGTRSLADVAGSYTYFADGDVLLAKITPCFENGKLGIARNLVNGVGFGSSEYIVIRPNPEVDADFLYHFLDRATFREEGAKQMTGAVGHKRVPKEYVEGTLIPVPTIEEQRRIVTLLDEAFADISIAKANAEKNLQNARGLFASRMQTLFDEDQSWERVQLEELLSRGWIESHLDGNHGSDYPRKEEFVESGVPYIAARALRGWEVDFSEAKYLSHERAATIRKGLAQDGDVLFAHNATVGPVGILKTNEPFVILGTSLTYYRCNEKFIQPEYLAHYMRSPAFVDQYSQVMKQSTRNQVPITKQREFFHIIPPLSIQQKIAGDLDSLAEKIEQLESIYREKLTALDDLKKSLLHQAFSGQL